MRIFIVGPPDSGKRELAFKIREKFPEFKITKDPELFLADVFGDLDFVPALHNVSDYRSELLLASYRACANLTKEPTIFTHSLFDSVAHATVNLANEFDNQGPLIEEWSATYVLMPYFIENTFTADLYIKMSDLELEEGTYAYYVNANLDELLEMNDITPTDSSEFDTIVDSIQSFYDKYKNLTR